MNQHKQTLIKALVSVCADSMASVRTCDAWRLYDMAHESGVLPEMKRAASIHNTALLHGMQEYENEIMEEAYNEA